MVARVDGQPRYFSAGKVTARLLISILALASKGPGTADSGSNTKGQAILSSAPNPIINPVVPEIPTHAEHVFTLRHIFQHGTNRNPTLHKKKDTPCAKSRPIYLTAEDGFPQEDVPMLRMKSQRTKIERLVDRRPRVVDALVATSRRNGFATALSPIAWTVDDVLAPDVTDRDTVLSLSYMAADAYARDEEDADWHDVLPPFNKTTDFGWESDGLRGHVFADEANSTVIIGLKGTSMAYFDGDGTTTNDKVNDNLFFSCCCAQQGQWSYHQVCDCATGTYECNNTCVVEALLQENRCYGAGRELFSNVTEMYPNANIWLAGHSLGGAVSSLLGLTYGVPVVTFEAVPDALPAGRLGLPVPPHADPGIPQAREWTGAYHFGHTADPVYIGTCNGATASCSYFGYAMESQCHTGFECVYDVVADKGWRVGIGTHRIRSVIQDVILQYETVPECKRIPECRDCNKWNMHWSNGTETTTSTSPTSTSTNTRIRTETCKTPGWWGCLDETSTGTITTTTTTTSTSQSTCKTPGWFGCKDKTTTEAATTASSSTTATTTCETPGWFWGCNDPTSTTATAPSSAAQSSSPVTPPPSTHTLPTSKNLHRPTSKSSQSWSCIHRNWYGRCTEWIGGDQTWPTAKPGYVDEM